MSVSSISSIPAGDLGNIYGPKPVNEPSHQVPGVLPVPADNISVVNDNAPVNNNELLTVDHVTVSTRPYSNIQYAQGPVNSGKFGIYDKHESDKNDIHYQPSVNGPLQYRYSYWDLFSDPDRYDLSAPDAEAQRWTASRAFEIQKSMPSSRGSKNWGAIDNKGYYGLWGTNFDQASNYYEARQNKLLDDTKYVYFSRPLSLKNPGDYSAKAIPDAKSKNKFDFLPAKRRLTDIERPLSLEDERMVKARNDLPHIPPNENDPRNYHPEEDVFEEHWNGQDWYHHNMNYPKVPGRKYTDDPEYSSRLNAMLGDEFDDIQLDSVKPLERPQEVSEPSSGHQPMEQDPGRKRKGSDAGNSPMLPPKPQGPPPQPKRIPPSKPLPPLPPPMPVIPVNHNPKAGGGRAGNEPVIANSNIDHIFYNNNVKIVYRSKRRKHKKGYNKYF